MSSGIIALMVGVSIILGSIALLALLWGLKTGQFDDEQKFINVARYDSEEELKDAQMMEQKREKAKKRKQDSGYRPPD